MQGPAGDQGSESFLPYKQHDPFLLGSSAVCGTEPCAGSSTQPTRPVSPAPAWVISPFTLTSAPLAGGVWEGCRGMLTMRVAFVMRSGPAQTHLSCTLGVAYCLQAPTVPRLQGLPHHREKISLAWLWHLISGPFAQSPSIGSDVALLLCWHWSCSMPAKRAGLRGAVSQCPGFIAHLCN